MCANITERITTSIGRFTAREPVEGDSRADGTADRQSAPDGRRIAAGALGSSRVSSRAGERAVRNAAQPPDSRRVLPERRPSTKRQAADSRTLPTPGVVTRAAPASRARNRSCGTTHRHRRRDHTGTGRRTGRSPGHTRCTVCPCPDRSRGRASAGPAGLRFGACAGSLPESARRPSRPMLRQGARRTRGKASIPEPPGVGPAQAHSLGELCERWGANPHGPWRGARRSGSPE